MATECERWALKPKFCIYNVSVGDIFIYNGVVNDVGRVHWARALSEILYFLLLSHIPQFYFFGNLSLLQVFDIMADLAVPVAVEHLVPPPLAGVGFLLNFVGFTNPVERFRLMEAGLAEYEDFRHLVEKDIRDLAEDFAKRTVANGRMTFGLGRTKKLIGVMHWIQDCFRTADDPDHMHFNEATLAAAQSRASVRKLDLELVDTNSKAANPGKFKDERNWFEWQEAFENYLSVIPGVNGVPLSYVIREQSQPNDQEEYLNFTERMVGRAPHQGPYFLADSRRVHNLLMGFLQGERTEAWIRPFARYQDGRRDIIALRRHYEGEGNSTRRIAEAKRIQNTLHYKSERSLPFNAFLGSLQKMFHIFEKQGEALTERAKVDELLTKCQHPDLNAAIAQLRFQLNTVGVTFTVAANHLNAAVAQTPDYQMARRNISSMNTNNRNGQGIRAGGRGGGRGGGRFNRRGRGGGRGRGRGGPDDKKNTTGYYSPADWNKLTYEERDKIRKERDKKGEQGGTKRNASDISVNQAAAIIAALQNNPTSETSPSGSSEETPDTQAGNAFGGKANVKKQKNSS